MMSVREMELGRHFKSYWSRLPSLGSVREMELGFVVEKYCPYLLFLWSVKEIEQGPAVKNIGPTSIHEARSRNGARSCC